MEHEGTGKSVLVARHNHAEWWILAFILCMFSCNIVRLSEQTKAQVEDLRVVVGALKAQVVRLEEQVQELSAPAKERPEEAGQ